MRIGLIVNPLAGLGGAFALKGSDADLARRALSAGARPIAGDRAAIALKGLAGRPVRLLTSAGAMGEAAALAAGLQPEIVHVPAIATSPDDTVTAARILAGHGVDLIVFAGGDGTARDLLRAVLGAIPVIGVPAGVKMHSAVFANSPAAAAAALAGVTTAKLRRSVDREVLDRDPDTGAPRLYGVLRTPAVERMQSAKAVGAATSDAQSTAEAATIAEELRHEPLAFVGPGATMMMVKAMLGGGTLLGVDAYAHGRAIALDADEACLHRLAAKDRPRIVLGVVGGQGFLVGRGNQQLSPRILRRAGTERLTVLADAGKLAALPDGALLVDSGDAAFDTAFAGHVPVRTGPRRTMMMRIDPA